MNLLLLLQTKKNINLIYNKNIELILKTKTNITYHFLIQGLDYFFRDHMMRQYVQIQILKS